VTLFTAGLIFLLALAYTTAYKKLKQAKALKIIKLTDPLIHS